MFKKVLWITAILMFLFVAAGCENEGPAEKAGAQIDDAVEEVQDKAEDVADEAEDVMDEAEDKMDQ